MSFPRAKTLSCRSSQGGFTLVEILVVIAIIALLASVALPAVTGALKKAQENAAVQVSHGITLALFQYSNDNDGTYPGTTAANGANAAVTVTTSSQAFELLYPTYINNTDVYFLKGNGRTKYAGTAAATGLAAANVGWDYTTGTGGIGLTSNDPDQVPLILSTGSLVAYPATVGTPGAATATISAVQAGTAPFGTDGVAVAFKDMSSAFETCKTVGTPFNISSASLSPTQTYNQLTP